MTRKMKLSVAFVFALAAATLPHPTSAQIAPATLDFEVAVVKMST